MPIEFKDDKKNKLLKYIGAAGVGIVSIFMFSAIKKDKNHKEHKDMRKKLSLKQSKNKLREYLDKTEA
ncbi:hypothetical protein NL50_17015 [Clostridium acetobutylicum]|nr:hypothetical protein NL50_17015 [Clostridium acetobutylicum]